MPISGEYVSLAAAARELGVSAAAITMALSAKTLTAEEVAGRRVIAREQLEQYKRDHAGRGWEARKAPNYAPSPAALRRREARARRKQQQQQQETATRAEGEHNADREGRPDD